MSVHVFENKLSVTLVAAIKVGHSEIQTENVIGVYLDEGHLVIEGKRADGESHMLAAYAPGAWDSVTVEERRGEKAD